MGLFSNKWFYTLGALFAFFVFSGDLVAHDVHDASGGCVTESQSGSHDSCPACAGCSIHNAAALPYSSAIAIGPNDRTTAFVLEKMENWAVGLPAAIDHPPQLS